MGLKITIEVDGQTEQQLAPVLNQWIVRGSPPLHHENPVPLQGQIQQLMAENTHLQAQLSHRQKRLVAAPIPRAIAPASQPSQSVEVSAVQPPLPNQYHPHRRAIVRRWFSRQVGGLVSRLLGKRRLLIVLLIAAGTVALAPQMVELLWPPTEYAGESEGGPGVVTEKTPSPEAVPAETVTGPPPGPASKAGSKSPPPPAFQ
ncbi:MAG: hypothetical protein AAGC93_07960 [Cyanobacteria bacterium P01_F01_bin.53]